MYGAPVALRLLTWNLLHGRSVPSAGHDLYDEFAAALERWPWDVALLQEVPPWWPARLGAHLQADARTVLTSRNLGLPLRRAIAVRRPDLIKSNGGGANAILVRGGGVREHRTRRLRRLPEGRWVHAVRLTNGAWIANLHVGNGDAAAQRDGGRAARTVLAWAGGSPVALGGDFNLHSPELPGFAFAGGHGVDQVFVRGLRGAAGGGRALDGGRLSDHAPVLVEVDGG